MTTQNPSGSGEQNGVEPEEFINKAEVARRLRKKLRTIDNWMKRGILPYYKMGRSVSFKWSDVQTHLQSHYRVCRRNSALMDVRRTPEKTL